MRTKRKLLPAALLVWAALAPLAGGLARGAEVFLRPAADIPGRHYSGDWSRSQVLELIRPRMEAVTVKYLSVSCSCLRVVMGKKDFAGGERVLLEVRNVKKTPAEGATYAIFAGLDLPEPMVIEYDIFVKSDPAPAP
ncbi:MAG: hypothetical protein LBU23_07750 [Planctomycetota bacterium]|jgi:hypothetical protein|nr:hypothetical protein [Planctomycetota bacterium]